MDGQFRSAHVAKYTKKKVALLRDLEEEYAALTAKKALLSALVSRPIKLQRSLRALLAAQITIAPIVYHPPAKLHHVARKGYRQRQRIAHRTCMPCSMAACCAAWANGGVLATTSVCRVNKYR
eukprot:SAG11_NODE_7997_length_1072_cov_0.882837_1_plen_123_part_00